jgi:hypothetical protein
VVAFPRADEVVDEVLASEESDDAVYITMSSSIAPLDVASCFARPDRWLRALFVSATVGGGHDRSDDHRDFNGIPRARMRHRGTSRARSTTNTDTDRSRL